MVKVPANSREKWLAIFEVASQRPGDEINDEWRCLLEQLRMSTEYYPALLEALRQGRWRNAKNTKAYLKTVAKREDFKEKAAIAAADPLVLMQISSEDGFSIESSLDHISYVRDTSEAVQGMDGIWRRGGGAERNEYERYDEDYDENPSSLRGRLLAKIPKSLKVVVERSTDYKEAVDSFNASTDEWHIHVEPSIQVDLEKWAELARFDEWELQVLRYRVSDVSRDEALAEQPDETSRKALQAAWMRYDRTGKRRLREAAEKKLEKDVPESGVAHTR